MQIEPMNPVLKPPRYILLKLRFVGPLSNFAFNFNLRHYVEGPAQLSLGDGTEAAEVKEEESSDDEGSDEEDADGNPKVKKVKDLSKYWGKIYIEFARLETAQIAATQFHRRDYDDRVVAVKYFPLQARRCINL